MKPTLLDLFSGAGGAAMGYYRAGFRVIGVDISPQKNYPFEFHQDDALKFCSRYGKGFDAIHASPPCQAYSALKTMWNKRNHPDLIGAVRDLLIDIDTIWVIENAAGAPLINPLMLCGSHFGLCASNGYQLRRHRYFESNVFFLNGNACHHSKRTVGVYGAKCRDIALEKRHYSKDKNTRGKPVGVILPKETGFQAMGIDWMSQDELSEAIPPAYTEFIGKHLLEVLQ